MAKKKKDTASKKAKAPPAPKDMLEVALYERRIIEALSLARIRQAKAQRLVEKIVAGTTDFINEKNREVLDLSRAIAHYADEHRLELTEQDKKKTVGVPGGGSLQWYSTPPAVSTDDKADEIIKKCKEMGFGRFIRTKEELDKEAMLRERDIAESIPGVSIGSGEKFVLRPMGRPERIERNIKTNRWKIVTEEEEPLPMAQAAE